MYYVNSESFTDLNEARKAAQRNDQGAGAVIVFDADAIAQEGHTATRPQPRLIHPSGDRVRSGDLVTSFRGECYKVVSYEYPHKPSSSGHINVRRANPTNGRVIKGSPSERFYVGVFGLVWINRHDRG